jgi:hypothetical protein
VRAQQGREAERDERQELRERQGAAEHGELADRVAAAISRTTLLQRGNLRVRAIDSPKHTSAAGASSAK